MYTVGYIAVSLTVWFIWKSADMDSPFLMYLCSNAAGLNENLNKKRKCDYIIRLHHSRHTAILWWKPAYSMSGMQMYLSSNRIAKIMCIWNSIAGHWKLMKKSVLSTVKISGSQQTSPRTRILGGGSVGVSHEGWREVRLRAITHLKAISSVKSAQRDLASSRYSTEKEGCVGRWLCAACCWFTGSIINRRSTMK